MTEPIDVDALERRFTKWDRAPQRQSAFDIMADMLTALRQQQREIKLNSDCARELESKWIVATEEIARLRASIQATFASHGLYSYHRTSSGSWERDRFESWIDGAAERAGLDIGGAAVKPRDWWEQLLTGACKALENEN